MCITNCIFFLYKQKVMYHNYANIGKCDRERETVQAYVLVCISERDY